MTAPVMAVPTPVTPVPVVPSMPAPMAMAVPVMMSPAHFLGLETIDIVLRNDRGLRGLAAWRQQSLR
jgi:hypothetical protein